MIRVFTSAICAATPLTAQQFRVERGQVEVCFAGTSSGETKPSCVGAAAEGCMASHEDGETTERLSNECT